MSTQLHSNASKNLDNYLLFSRETQDKLDEINILLKKKCPDYYIELKENLTGGRSELRLETILKNGENQLVSHVTMFTSDCNTIHINLQTQDIYKGNRFITFLIAVLVLIGNTITFNSGETATKISLDAFNPTSGHILEHNFEVEKNSEREHDRETARSREETEDEKEEREDREYDERRKLENLKLINTMLNIIKDCDDDKYDDRTFFKIIIEKNIKNAKKSYT